MDENSKTPKKKKKSILVIDKIFNRFSEIPKLCRKDSYSETQISYKLHRLRNYFTLC